MEETLSVFVGQGRTLLNDFASKAAGRGATVREGAYELAAAIRQFVDGFTRAIETLIAARPVDGALAALLLECCTQTQRLAARNEAHKTPLDASLIARNEALTRTLKAMSATRRGA